MNRIIAIGFAVATFATIATGTALADHPAHPLTRPLAHSHDCPPDYPPGFGPFGAPLGDTAGSSEHGQGTGPAGWR